MSVAFGQAMTFSTARVAILRASADSSSPPQVKAPQNDMRTQGEHVLSLGY